MHCPRRSRSLWRASLARPASSCSHSQWCTLSLPPAAPACPAPLLLTAPASQLPPPACPSAPVLLSPQCSEGNSIWECPCPCLRGLQIHTFFFVFRTYSSRILMEVPFEAPGTFLWKTCGRTSTECGRSLYWPRWTHREQRRRKGQHSGHMERRDILKEWKLSIPMTWPFLPRLRRQHCAMQNIY